MISPFLNTYFIVFTDFIISSETQKYLMAKLLINIERFLDVPEIIK